MKEVPALVLPGIVVVSSLGALIVCGLLFRYGFVIEPDADIAPWRRLAYRGGCVAALACFAVATLLGVVALAAHQNAARSAAGLRAARASERAEQRRLDADVHAVLQRLGERVDADEQRLDHPARLDAQAPPAPRRSRSPRVSDRSAKARSVLAPPSAASVAAVASRVGDPSEREGDAFAAAALAPPSPATTAPMPTSAPAPRTSGTVMPDPPSDPHASMSTGPGPVAPDAVPPSAAPSAEAASDEPQAAPPPASGERASVRCPAADAAESCSRAMRWIRGEVDEFREGVKRQVQDARDGFDRVKVGWRRLRDRLAPTAR